jgi:hypothetical protein
MAFARQLKLNKVPYYAYPKVEPGAVFDTYNFSILSGTRKISTENSSKFTRKSESYRVDKKTQQRIFNKVIKPTTEVNPYVLCVSSSVNDYLAHEVAFTMLLGMVRNYKHNVSLQWKCVTPKYDPSINSSAMRPDVVIIRSVLPEELKAIFPPPHPTQVKIAPSTDLPATLNNIPANKTQQPVADNEITRRINQIQEQRRVTTTTGGTVVVRNNDYEENLDDGREDITSFEFITLGDYVTDPSAPNAYLSAIMEGKNWLFDLSKLKGKEKEVADNLNRANDVLKKMNRKDIEKEAVSFFTDYFNILTNKKF